MEIFHPDIASPMGIVIVVLEQKKSPYFLGFLQIGFLPYQQTFFRGDSLSSSHFFTHSFTHSLTHSVSHNMLNSIHLFSDLTLITVYQSVHSQYIHSMFSIHSQYILSTFLVHSQYILNTFSVNSKYFLSTFSVNSLYIR